MFEEDTSEEDWISVSSEEAATSAAGVSKKSLTNSLGIKICCFVPIGDLRNH